MDIIKTGFGNRLKDIRKRCHYTQEYLAEKLGINIRQLAKIEAGTSFVRSYTLYKICTVLNVSPAYLFYFDVDENLKTGTGDVLHFSAIKSGNLIQLTDKTMQIVENSSSDFDSKMTTLAQSLDKDINVDEIVDGVIVMTKTFKPDGEIIITNQSQENEIYENLKNKLASIAQDKKRLDFLNLAFDSITDKEALKNLKILIQGIELTQE